MKIRIETIPHEKQRYPTVGDWHFANTNCFDGKIEKDTLVIRVSKLGDWRQELLIAVHELVEVAIAHARGVSVKEVDRFDMAYENERASRLRRAKSQAEKDLLLIDEPGDDPKCPIKREHSIATGFERILAAELGVDWKPYEEKIEHL